MERKDIEKWLYNALQPDDAIRRDAELRITDLQSKEYCYFLQNIVAIFSDPNSPIQLKMISGIIMKNSLHSTDIKIQEIYEQKWEAIDSNLRETLKSYILNSFNDPNEKVYNLAGSAIGYIARIELAKNGYQEFFSLMEQVMIDETRAPAVLEAVSTCCVKLSEETAFNFEGFLGSIFNICMIKLENPSSSPLVKEVSLKCMMNCFKTIGKIFEQENAVMRFLTCIAMTAAADASLTAKSLICLNRFVFLNYKIINSKIMDIINYFNNYWNYPNEDVLVQVVEFWTILAEIKDFDLVEKNLEFLFPHILRLMIKNENYIDQNWNSHKAAAYFLETISETYGSKVFFSHPVFSYIESELSSNDKIRIDAGAVTLGSVVVKGCDEQLVNFIKVLIMYMRDPVTEESCLWALAKICETNFFAVVEHLSILLKQACEIIISRQSSSTTAAWILNSIFISLNAINKKTLYSTKFSLETQTTLKEYGVMQVKNHFTDVLRILIAATENVGLEDSTLRVALFAALAEQVRYTDAEHWTILDEVIMYCQTKIIECAVAVNKAATNYIPIIEDVLSNYIALSQVVALKRKKDSAEILYPAYMAVLKSKPSSAMGEVYIAVTTNILDFLPCLEEFIPFIARDLGCLDSFILKSAINLIGCMANTIEKNFFHLSTQLIPLLIQNLSSKHISKQVKTQILSVFGDIALSLGTNFEQYLEMSMMIYTQIVTLERESYPNYVDDLRFNVMQMFNCIVLATCESHKLREIMYKLVEGIKTVINDSNSDETLIAIVNLITDLKSVFGLHYDLDGRWVDEFFSRCMDSNNVRLRTAVQKASY